MKILLIRHGETTGDVENRYGGQYDDDLTQLGREQLQATAQLLVGQPVEKLFVSTLRRAAQSAAIINEVLLTDIEMMDGLQERNYGILSGLTKDEAQLKYPEAVELHKEAANTDPDGEAQRDFTARVLATFTFIAERPHGVVAIVTHGGVIKTILRHLQLPLPPRIGDGEIIEVSI